MAPSRRRCDKPLRVQRTQPMSTYFTSDHHFGHAGALGLYRRPFASIAEMDQKMIERWNAVVKPAEPIPLYFNWGLKSGQRNLTFQFSDTPREDRQNHTPNRTGSRSTMPIVAATIRRNSRQLTLDTFRRQNIVNPRCRGVTKYPAERSAQYGRAPGAPSWKQCNRPEHEECRSIGCRCEGCPSDRAHCVRSVAPSEFRPPRNGAICSTKGS